MQNPTAQNPASPPKGISSAELNAGLDAAAAVMAVSFFELYEAAPDGEIRPREPSDVQVRIMGDVLGAFADAVYGPAAKPRGLLTALMVSTVALWGAKPPMSIGQAQAEIGRRAADHLGFVFEPPHGTA